MWGMGQLGLCYELSLLYNLIFGSLISATDPV
jgi:NhaP-type Na+/H+ or K+/H+ antiporter